MNEYDQWLSCKRRIDEINALLRGYCVSGPPFPSKRAIKSLREQKRLLLERLSRFEGLSADSAASGTLARSGTGR